MTDNITQARQTWQDHEAALRQIGRDAAAMPRGGHEPAMLWDEHHGRSNPEPRGRREPRSLAPLVHFLDLRVEGPLCAAPGWQERKRNRITEDPLEVTCGACIGRDQAFTNACIDRLWRPGGSDKDGLFLDGFADEDEPDEWRVCLVIPGRAPGAPFYGVVHGVPDREEDTVRVKAGLPVRTICGARLTHPEFGMYVVDGMCRRCQRIARQRRARALREREAES